jgi:hypothetical protein
MKFGGYISLQQWWVNEGPMYLFVVRIAAASARGEGTVEA